MEVIIEVLGTTHNVIERQKFDQARISFGRAYSNDVILGDEHIDQQHAELVMNEEGSWQLRDTDSLNGVRRFKPRQSIESAAVESGDVFLLGRNKVRILFADHPVAKTVKLRRIETMLLWIGRPQVLFLLVLLYLGATYLGVLLTATGEIKWGQVISEEVFSTFGIVLLAVLVYFLSVLFKRGGNFLSHLALLIVVFLLLQVFGVGIRIMLFNTGSVTAGLSEWLLSSSNFLVLFIYLWSVLYLAFHLSLKVRTGIAVAAVAVIVILNMLQGDPMEEWNYARIKTDNTLMPPEFLLSSPRPQTDYFDQAFTTFTAADEARAEQLEERQDRR